MLYTYYICVISGPDVDQRWRKGGGEPAVSRKLGIGKPEKHDIASSIGSH